MGLGDKIKYLDNAENNASEESGFVRDTNNFAQYTNNFVQYTNNFYSKLFTSTKNPHF